MSELPEAARAFIEGDVDLMPKVLSTVEIDALVALLVERGDIARLQRLADSKDKSQAKPARRGLHLLRSRGTVIPEPQPRTYRVRGPYAEAEQPSMASLIDGRGERIVWLVRPATEGTGFEVYQAEISETRGLIGFAAGAAPRKEWRERAHKVLADPRLGVAEVSSVHARWLIEQAYERTLAAGRVAPEEFARAKLDLGPVTRPDRHPAIDAAPALPLGEVRESLKGLFALREVATWIPEKEALDALDVAVGEIVTSKLVVEPAQRLEQLGIAVGRIADQSLTPALRARLAERLHETAYLLAHRGQMELAQRCTTAAALMLDESVPGSENPLYRQMFDKLIDQQKLVDAPRSV
jgi:hypothetical protein